jgi:glycerol kinase
VLGLTRDAGRAHVVRAALESVAYQTQDLLSALAADGMKTPKSLRVDGGMVANHWLLQFLADVTGLPVERPAYAETTVQGAAFLAGLGAGHFQSTGDIATRWQQDFSATPRLAAARRTELLAGWQDAISRVAVRDR